MLVRAKLTFLNNFDWNSNTTSALPLFDNLWNLPNDEYIDNGCRIPWHCDSCSRNFAAGFFLSFLIDSMRNTEKFLKLNSYTYQVCHMPCKNDTNISNVKLNVHLRRVHLCKINFRWMWECIKSTQRNIKYTARQKNCPFPSPMISLTVEIDRMGKKSENKRYDTGCKIGMCLRIRWMLLVLLFFFPFIFISCLHFLAVAFQELVTYIHVACTGSACKQRDRFFLWQNDKRLGKSVIL